MSDDSKVLGVIILFLCIPFSIMWRGYVLSIMWVWFVVPFGVDPLSVAHLIGLSITVGMFSGIGIRGDYEGKDWVPSSTYSCRRST